MKFQYGFKSEANRWSRDLRSELGFKADDPLCPWELSKHLAIPIQELSQYDNFQKSAVKYLSSFAGKREFSAVTYLDDKGHRVILHNDFHDRKRQASNIAHEIAHALLGHPMHTILDKSGKRVFNKEHEAEASWLGPALLISDEAALFVVESGMTLEEASAHFSVTKDIIQMRINVSAAKRRVA